MTWDDENSEFFLEKVEIFLCFLLNFFGVLVKNVHIRPIHSFYLSHFKKIVDPN